MERERGGLEVLLFLFISNEVVSIIMRYNERNR